MNAQSNSFIEAASHNIRRQMDDLERVSGTLTTSLTVDGVPVDSYLTRYPIMSPLREIVNGIHVSVAKIEDDLKLRVSEYNNVRSQLNAINRKQTGRTFGDPPCYCSEEKDWLSCYETLTTYVVPRSSKLLHEDNEYALYTVTVFNRDADNFRSKARERGFQESRKQELEKLMQDRDSLRLFLQWCYTSYGEVFTAWMHFCAVYVFAESILIYGLPPTFLSVVLSPSIQSEKKVRSRALSDTSNRCVQFPKSA